MTCKNPADKKIVTYWYTDCNRGKLSGASLLPLPGLHQLICDQPLTQPAQTKLSFIRTFPLAPSEFG